MIYRRQTQAISCVGCSSDVVDRAMFIKREQTNVNMHLLMVESKLTGLDN